MVDNDVGATGRVPRWWGAVCLLCGIPFFAVFAYFGYPDKGLVATYAVALIVLVARIFWRLHRQAWFWAMLIGISALHGLLVAFVHFSRTRYPIILVAAPFVLLDFIAVFLTFRFAEKRAR
jgi:hypothetical protein